MTDDPRLDAVKKAYADHCAVFDFPHARKRSEMFCAMFDAAIAFYADRREVMHYSAGRDRSRQNNAPAPAPVVGADPHHWYGPCDRLAPNGECAECLKRRDGIDPPWLDEAAWAAKNEFFNYPFSSREVAWLAATRAVLRVANAQPVSKLR